MLNIYVLEDHFIQQNRIEEVIHTILKKNNIKVGDFEVFDKPNQLLDFITERGSHQLFFLDIQIKDCFLHDSFRVSSLNFSIPIGSSRLYW